MKPKHILSALAFSGVTAVAAGQAGHVDKLPQGAPRAPVVLSTAEFGAKDGPLSDDSAAEAAALEQATAARSLLRSQWMYKTPKRGIKAWKSTFGTRDPGPGHGRQLQRRRRGEGGAHRGARPVGRLGRLGPSRA